MGDVGCAVTLHKHGRLTCTALLTCLDCALVNRVPGMQGLVDCSVLVASAKVSPVVPINFAHSFLNFIFLRLVTKLLHTALKLGCLPAPDTDMLERITLEEVSTLVLLMFADFFLNSISHWRHSLGSRSTAAAQVRMLAGFLNNFILPTCFIGLN